MAMLERATEFIWRDARLLERALFARRFLNGPAVTVHDAVRAYRTADGGFGHALEPDVRGPVSHPLHVQQALAALEAAGVLDRGLALGVCSYLASVSRPDGRVPFLLPAFRDYPHAAYCREDDQGSDDPNPTAAIVGLLWFQGVSHPWLDRAARWCWQRLESPIAEAHALRTALTFLRFAPERERAAALADRIAAQAFGASYFRADPEDRTYGLTPLQLVPSPDAPGRTAFPDALLDAHLDHLIGQQQADGGWPISFAPPSGAASHEWRGIATLEALMILRAYGRI